MSDGEQEEYLQIYSLVPADVEGYPPHESLAKCWCHPKMIYRDLATGNEYWEHKDPSKGEYDA